MEGAGELEADPGGVRAGVGEPLLDGLGDDDPRNLVVEAVGELEAAQRPARRAAASTLRMPSAWAPSSWDWRPITVASLGVTCGTVSSFVSRWITADAVSALIRARAIGLSLTSTASTAPEAARRAAVSTSASRFAPFGGSSSTSATHSPAASFASSRERSALRLGAAASERAVAATRRRGSRSSSTAALIAAIWVGVEPQHAPMMRAPSERAWAANSAK